MKFAIAVIAVVLAFAAVIAWELQARGDGPYGPLMGGPLRSGELIASPINDWTHVLNSDFSSPNYAEFELLGTRTSRTTGYMVRDGVLYIPCDLGFMWNRFSGQRKRILNVLYVVKTWHESAERDGRAMLRVDGRLYPVNAVRVTDAALIDDLKTQLEDMGREWLAPEELGPPPTEGPRDIWFFRLDHRDVRA